MREISRNCSVLNAFMLGECDAETLWRRERDSNPRYPFRYSSFQDCLFQPLTHPSTNDFISSRMARCSVTAAALWRVSTTSLSFECTSHLWEQSAQRS